MTRTISPRGSVKWASASAAVPTKVSSCSFVSSRHTAMRRSGSASAIACNDLRRRVGASKATRVSGRVAASSSRRCSSPAAARQEAGEAKLGTTEAGNGQRGYGRRGTGYREHFVTGLPRRCDEVDAGVADRRRARIGHECNVTLREAFQYLRDALPHVVVRIADELRVQAVVSQEDAGGAGVFGGHERDLGQHTQSAQADVLQVADRRGYDV